VGNVVKSNSAKLKAVSSVKSIPRIVKTARFSGIAISYSRISTERKIQASAKLNAVSSLRAYGYNPDEVNYFRGSAVSSLKCEAAIVKTATAKVKGVTSVKALGNSVKLLKFKGKAISQLKAKSTKVKTGTVKISAKSYGKFNAVQIHYPHFTGSATSTISVTYRVPNAATVSAVSSLKASCTLTKSASAKLSGYTTITAVPQMTISAKAKLYGMSTATAYPTASLSAKLSGVTTLTAFGGVPLYASAKLSGVSYGKFVGTWYERETAPSMIEPIGVGINIKPIGDKITVKPLGGGINIKRRNVP